MSMRDEIRAILERDPAAKNMWDVFFFYPGFHAVQSHRVAHWLYKRNRIFLARFLSFCSRFFTGIEIHPAAQIGKGLFIDHGAGVVIGETAEIGNYVTLYQGVTLGGTGNETGKRHPTIGDYVIVGSGAKVLGSFKVGDYSRIGAGSVVLKEVPAYSTFVGIPGNVIKSRKIDDLNSSEEAAHLLRSLRQEIEHLQSKVLLLETRSEQVTSTDQEFITSGKLI